MLTVITITEAYINNDYNNKNQKGRYKHWNGLLDWTIGMAFIYILLYRVVFAILSNALLGTFSTKRFFVQT